MDVIYPNDISYIDFQKDVVSKTAFYILIWPYQILAADENRYVYVGQTGNGGDRIKQHIKKGRQFECACVFTLLDAEFTRTDVMYLEYVSIVHIVEQGSANLMDNCQIPTRPSVKQDDIQRLNNYFYTIQKMTAFAGYHVFTKRRFICSDDIGTRRNLAKRLTEQYLKMGPVTTDKDYRIYSNEESVEDSDEVLVKYIADGSGWHAECIPMNDDKFFIMPNSTVDVSVVPMMVCEDSSVYEPVGEYVDYKTHSIPRGMTVDSLEIAARIVCGRPDAAIWKMTRTIV